MTVTALASTSETADASIAVALRAVFRPGVARTRALFEGVFTLRIEVLALKAEVVPVRAAIAIGPIVRDVRVRRVKSRTGVKGVADTFHPTARVEARHTLVEVFHTKNLQDPVEPG